MSQPRRLCTFYLDGLFVGIDVSQVQEVFRFQNMTPVPLARAGHPRAHQSTRPDRHRSRSAYSAWLVRTANRAAGHEYRRAFR